MSTADSIRQRAPYLWRRLGNRLIITPGTLQVGSDQVVCRQCLGGLLNDYERAA